MNSVYLSLGSNIGNRINNLVNAVKKLKPKGENFSFSSVYETSPWGFETEYFFLNMVIGFQTSLNETALLSFLLETEKELGRKRNPDLNGYESRIIDIDILYFNNEILNSELITIPHPRLNQRKFVLIPLCELTPDYIHPVDKKSNSQLLFECKDTSDVRLFCKFALT